MTSDALLPSPANRPTKLYERDGRNTQAITFYIKKRALPLNRPHGWVVLDDGGAPTGTESAHFGILKFGALEC
jgi:hypothetical protein